MDRNQKKKVLFIETGMGFGGSAISLKEIVENIENYTPFIVFYARKSAYFTDIFSSVPARYFAMKFTYQQKGTLTDFIVKYTKSTFLTRMFVKIFSIFSFAEDVITTRRITKIIKEHNIDLMHINNRIDPIAIKAAIKCNIPCIVHSRGHEPDPAKKEYIHYMTRLIAPTKKIADHEELSLGVPREKISVLYDTIDVDSFAENKNRERIRSSYGIASEDIVIAMFARIIPMKGQLVLTKAIKQLRAQGHNVTCMFVGDSSDYGKAYLQDIEKYITINNLENDFVFAGYQNDTASYYAAADIIVHPSIDEEAFGRIIIEAWAAKRPIIASNIGASVELIDHEKTGLLVSKNDSSDLSNAIERLIKDDFLYETLARNSKIKAQDFRNGHLINELEAMYENIINKIVK
ncbi:glycosyltransferase family 4 protein [Marinobacter sp.]|uniref:glycosyltransferase family 4 protein n=1 Tax=Marinobacter sp. TaxID=50741 RepID=UPI00198698FB|nr:glycosyltransferase family 4 protein [Marinobacter sp.]MBC7191027.1 glycosyltransferase family 4 protein [Marinobacter sp.]